MENIEIRFMTSDLVTTDDGVMLVEGLVNRTDSWSNELGQRRKFTEKINRGAFSKALMENRRVDFLMEHDPTKLLATTQNGSLTLFEDEEGLKMRAEIVPTSYGKDLYALMKSRIINHMSFGFKAVSDKWKKLSDGTYQREIDALKLFEVSAVRTPAYPQSLISARGLNVVENEDEIIPEGLDEEIRTDEQPVEQVETQPTEPIVETPIVEPVVEQPTVQTEPEIVEPIVETQPTQTVTLEQFNQLMQMVSGLNEKFDKVTTQTEVIVPTVEVETKIEPTVEETQVQTPPDLSAFYEKIKQVKEI